MLKRKPRKSLSALGTISSQAANTVATVVALHERAQLAAGPSVRRISRMSAALGRPTFLVSVMAAVGTWMLVNVAASRLGLVPLDAPPFPWLQGAVSLAALLMTTVVLITQNRQNRHIEHRARLDLQVNLLAEQKVTKIIGLLEELRRDMPNVRNRVDRVADEMKQPVDTDAVLSALEKTLEPARVVSSTDEQKPSV